MQNFGRSQETQFFVLSSANDGDYLLDFHRKWTICINKH